MPPSPDPAAPARGAFLRLLPWLTAWVLATVGSRALLFGALAFVAVAWLGSARASRRKASPSFCARAPRRLASPVPVAVS
jgi:hypothetical protein